MERGGRRGGYGRNGRGGNRSGDLGGRGPRINTPDKGGGWGSKAGWDIWSPATTREPESSAAAAEGSKTRAPSTETLRCFQCGGIGHYAQDCSGELRCFICQGRNHVSKNCNLKKNPPVAHFYGGAGGLGFYYIEGEEEEDKGEDHNDWVVVTACEGKLSKEMLDKFFKRLINEGDWAVKNISESSFLLKFKDQKWADTCVAFGSVMVEGTTVKFESWAVVEERENTIPRAWVQIRGLPLQRRTWKTVARAASCVGMVLEIDIPTLNKGDFARVLIACADPMRIPVEVPVAIGRRPYLLEFDVENLQAGVMPMPSQWRKALTPEEEGGDGGGQQDPAKRLKSVANPSPSSKEGQSKAPGNTGQSKRTLELTTDEETEEEQRKKEGKESAETEDTRRVLLSPMGGGSEVRGEREKERRISKEGSRGEGSESMEDGEVESQGNIYALLPTESDFLEEMMNVDPEEETQPSPGKRLKKKITSPPIATRRSERVKDKDTVPALAMQRQKRRNLDLSTIKGASSSNFSHCIQFSNISHEDLIDMSRNSGIKLGDNDTEILNNITRIQMKEVERATNFIEQAKITNGTPPVEEVEEPLELEHEPETEDQEGEVEERALKELKCLDNKKKKKKNKLCKG